jgi:hypothetical protein
MIDRRKAEKQLDEVQSMGGLILFCDNGAKSALILGKEKVLKKNLDNMIRYIGDMQDAIDDLIKTLGEA